MQEPWISGGFAFYDKSIADQASREVEAVDYLRSRLEGARPQVVYQMYQQIIQQKLFSTPVGYSYLKELRDYLTITAGYEDGSVEAIPVKPAETVPTAEPAEAVPTAEPDAGSHPSKQPDKEKTGGESVGRNASRMRFLLGVNILLVVAIVAMFVITLTSSNTTILNYENQIIDKYENWEQELEQREAELKEREAQLAE